MPVQTRSQTHIQKLQLVSTDEPVIMPANESAAGKPPCYLAWGRFLTEKEYHASVGKTMEEVSNMIASNMIAKKVDNKAACVSASVYDVEAEGPVDPMTVAAGLVDGEEGEHFPEETTHGLGWNANAHYMSIGGQCGQSCVCCRADVYKSGLDEDAKWGACSICLST